MVRGELNHRAILVASGKGGRGRKGEMLKGRENMGEKGRGEGEEARELSSHCEIVRIISQKKLCGNNLCLYASDSIRTTDR